MRISGSTTKWSSNILQVTRLWFRIRTPIAAATVLRRSRIEARVRSALRRRLWRAQTLGRTQIPMLDDSSTNRLCRSRYSILHQKSKHDAPSTSPPNRNTLSSTPGKRICGSKGGNREGLTPDPSTGGDKKNPWNGQEAEADNQEEYKEKHDGDGDKKTTPLLGSTKKRGPSTVEGKSASKRCVKRRRCSSPDGDEAVGSQGGCGMRICISESEWPV